MILGQDLSSYAPLVKEWGPAGMLVVVAGLFSWYVLPKLIVITSNLSTAISGSTALLTELKKEREHFAEEARSILQRAEELYPKPKSMSLSIHSDKG